MEQKYGCIDDSKSVGKEQSDDDADVPNTKMFVLGGHKQYVGVERTTN